jgi:hypothetical protein
MSRSRCLAAALGLCLAVAGSLAMGAEHTFDGNYSGKRVLAKGSDPECPAVDDVSVSIHTETLTFINGALRKFVIGFFLRQDGSFDQIGTADGDTVHILGRITGDVIEADVNNPPCEYHWYLKKAN